MNELLQRYLDGEIPLDALPQDLRMEARRWDERLDSAGAAGPAGMPAGLEGRILRAVEEEAGSSGVRRALAWLVRPRPIPVSPLTGALAAAALVVLLLAPWRDGAPVAGPGNGAPPSAAAPAGEIDVIVEFVLQAPDARSVAVAGDFTTWAPEVELQDPDGDGVWAGRVRLRPGMHKYMFVIDGTRWVTDPLAGRYVDDGFGNRNAVLVVAGESRS